MALRKPSRNLTLWFMMRYMERTIKHLSKKILPVAIALSILVLTGELTTHIIGEILWFQEVGYVKTFLERLLWQLGLFGLISAPSLGFLLFNLRLASRWGWKIPKETTDKPIKRKRKHCPESRPLRLSRLLALVLGFNLLISLMVLYYSQIAIAVWTPDFNLANITRNQKRGFKIKIVIIVTIIPN